MLGYQGLANAATAFTYPQHPQQAFGFATTQPVEREHKIEVPIVEKGDDRAGIFLKGEHGELVHITSERLYQMAGIEW